MKNINFYKKYKDLTLETMFSRKILEIYFNTVVSYLYKGNQSVEQNFSIKKCKQGSLLSKLMNKKNEAAKEFIKINKITTFTISQYFLYSLLQILEKKGLINNVIVMSEPKKIKKELIEKIEQVLQVKSLKESYEKEEILFTGIPGDIYKKRKYATKEELDECIKVINTIENQKK